MTVREKKGKERKSTTASPFRPHISLGNRFPGYILCSLFFLQKSASGGGGKQGDSKYVYSSRDIGPFFGMNFAVFPSMQ